ncbi:MAG: hypothetical protein RLZZ09_720, partial [Pseudomonadota bacterium]
PRTPPSWPRMSCSVWHSAISDSPAQIFYRYLTQIGIVPLIGTTSNQHMHEDLAIFEYELLPSECESLDGLI